MSSTFSGAYLSSNTRLFLLLLTAAICRDLPPVAIKVCSKRGYIMNENSKYTCPNCGSDNTASIPLEYKRGHIYGEETRSELVGYNVEKEKITYKDGHTETKEVNRTPIYQNVTRPTVKLTSLAAEIAPPPSPIEPKPESDGCFVCIVKGIISAVVGFMISSVLGTVVGNALFYDFLSDYLVKGVVATLVGGILLLLSLVGIAAMVYMWLGEMWFKFSGKKQRFEQEMQVYNEQMIKYREMYAQWEHLYICMRCGHKFYVD